MKRAIGLLGFLLSVTLCLFAQSAGVNAPVSKAGMDPERLARIPSRMKEFVEEGRIAGAVMLVARHGEVASLEAVGYQDLESKTPMRTDTIFQIRSMTKSVTAVAIMVLLDEGRLLLSDPVEKHLPEFRDQLMVESREGEKVLTTKKPSRPITIRDLLTHTSGMPDNLALPAEITEHVFVKRDKLLAEIVPLLAQIRADEEFVERMKRLGSRPAGPDHA